MAKTAPTTFATVRSEGGLLPPDLLARIVANDPELGGLTPTDYGADKGAKLTEVAAQVWANCKIYWEAFKATRSRLGEGESGLTETREQWVLPLFRELGYGRLTYRAAAEIVDDRSFPISHRAGEVEEAPPIHVVAFDQDLDRGEGRRTVAGGLRVSPQGLMQDYLNRTPHLWGIVTNGRQLRLLRDNESLTRAAYVEFNLEAMLEGGVYADFVLLYLLLHRSRLPQGQKDASECWLEKWRLVAVEGGTRALDALRDGVTTAVKVLGQGLLEHQANEALRQRLVSGDLSVSDYYRQLLRLIYRLLFLLVAEERDLLFAEEVAPRLRDVYNANYSVSRLRERAERHRREDRHNDVWHSLRVTFGMLRDGCSALGLAPLSGGLFNEHSCPDLDGAHLTNAVLLAALRGLSLVTLKGVQRHVNYRDLNVEELGSVYESLLDLYPVLQREGVKPRFELVEGSERKTTGSYYTPSSLVAELIKSAMEPAITRALAAGNTPEVRRRALLQLTVCDPAAGSGHFLLAAARRIGREVARLDAGEAEPDLVTLRGSVREVIRHCIYGVDLNPLAVDLCKLALWIEGHNPGKPLTFLDHRIQCGNSLIGTTPDLLEHGIPDEAFEFVEGDDKSVCREYRKRNKDERIGTRSLFDASLQPWAELGDVADSIAGLNATTDDTIEGVRSKQETYEQLTHTESYLRSQLRADAWCAAIVWEKTKIFDYPITEEVFRRLSENPLTTKPWMREEIERLRDQYRFFHWHLAFPSVFKAQSGSDENTSEEHFSTHGFDVILGNPPWEKIQIEERLYFSGVDSRIAQAGASDRKRLIKELAHREPGLFQRYVSTLRAVNGQAHFIKASGRYPLTGKGNVSTNSVFVELSMQIGDRRSQIGLIVPTGLATQDSQKDLYGALTATGRLRKLYDFENRKPIFHGVHSSFKFCIVIIGGNRRDTSSEYSFYLQDVEELRSNDRIVRITRGDLERFSPNTLSCPTVRNSGEMRILTTIYRNSTILLSERLHIDPWGWRSRQMFNETHEASELRPWTPSWPNDGLVRLYEAKLMHQFDHRYATYVHDSSELKVELLSQSAKNDPDHLIQTRFCVSSDIWTSRVERGTSRLWVLAFRRIARATDERTSIFAVLPACVTGSQTPIAISNQPHCLVAALLANLNSYAFDFATRLRVGGTDLNHFIVHQLPVITPDRYTSGSTPLSLDEIVARTVELTYTAWDLAPFAHDCGYYTSPFPWQEDRRFLLRCELDAAFFHLYGIARDDAAYIMNTFPIVRRKDESEFGEYRTKRVILEIYDEMQRALIVGAPYKTLLDPPPADPRVANRAITVLAEPLI